MKKNKYYLLKSIRNYRFHSIFLKNFILIFGVILLPFICILWISTYTYNELQLSEEKIYTDKLRTRIYMDVENLFYEIRDKAILLSYDQDVKMFCQAKNVEDDTFYDPNNIFKFVSLYNISTDIIDSVYVYAPYNRGVISAAGRSSYSKFSDQECIDRWVDDDKQYQFEYISREYIGKEKNTLSFFFKTNQVANRKCVIIINISIKKLAKALEYGDNTEVLIVGNNQILFDSTDERNGIYVDDTAELILEDDNKIVVCEEMGQFGLETIVSIDGRPLYERLGATKKFIIACTLVMLLVSIVFVFYISQKIFDPISEILNALESDANAEEKKILENRNEVSYIRNAIYATMSKHKDIEEELLTRVKLLKKAQIVALQAQINPHFLNNTLETVNWMIIGKLGIENEISEILNCLSQILRFSMEDADTFVTLHEEIEYVKKYLFIQQTRINAGFDVVWNVSEELEDCKVNKMILQPIVENSIKYGILPYDDRGELRIEVFREEDILYIRVRDSGVSLTQDEVDEINRSMREQVIKESNHIGLSNVNQRMVLFFGEEYGVTIKSKFNEGVLVELRMPYQE